MAPFALHFPDDGAQALESLEFDCRKRLSAQPNTAEDEAAYRTVESLLDLESAAEDIESASESALLADDGLEHIVRPPPSSRFANKSCRHPS